MPVTPFGSMLFLRDVPLATLAAVREPDHFHDLQLDQLVGAICGKARRANLQQLFWFPLTDVEAIVYRQDCLRESERPAVRAALQRFGEGIDQVRQGQTLHKNLHYRLQQQRCLVEVAREYCETIARFSESLDDIDLHSDAFRALRDYLRNYVSADRFRVLRGDIAHIVQSLDEVIYTLLIARNRILVTPYEGQSDLSSEIVDLFSRFQPDETAAASRSNPFTYSGFGHVDAQILDQVSRQFPEPFEELDAFCSTHVAFVDHTISRVGHEVQFLLAWVGFKARLADAGLPMCYPTISTTGDCVAVDCFDVALAAHRVETAAPVVKNSIDLAHHERLVVVTGPNQGGKTTFARAIGQLHYLASLGCPVPGTKASIARTDQIFVHFEREESPDSQRGKLQDDLIRMRAILDAATDASVIVLNELFSSTTTDDALRLAQKVFARIKTVGSRCVCVTFLDELASYDKTTVSMVGEVDPSDPSVRTYAVTRRPADGRAYAAAIARKYQLTTEQVTRRLAS